MNSNNIDKKRDQCKMRMNKCVRSKCCRCVVIFLGLIFSILIVISEMGPGVLILMMINNVPDFSQNSSGIENRKTDTFNKKTNPIIESVGDFSEQINKMPSDLFSTLNKGDTRFKRDISRARRNCEMSAKRCAILLQTMENYLKTLKNNVLSDGNPVPIPDILNCLRCKNLQPTIANQFEEDPTPRSQDQYFPHDVEEDRTSDSGIAVIKLLDNEEAKRAEVNRMKAARVQVTVTESLINDVSQDSSANSSLKNISTTSVNDEESTNGDLITIDSHTKGIQIDEMNFSATSNDRQIESKDAITSDIVTLQFDTTESSSTTQRTKDDAMSKGYSVESSEMNTQYPMNLTKQSAIAENVTATSGYDVTGIDSDDDSTVHPSVHPSVQPSFDGHPENQSAATINVSESTTEDIFSDSTSDDRFETKNSSEPIQATSEGTKFSQQLQISPTMLHPVCIFDYSVSEFSDMPSPASFYSNSSDPSIEWVQNRGFLFQKSPYRGSSNYMQLQPNTMQFIRKFSLYGGNPPQAQPSGQDADIAGSATSNVSPISLNQQPMARAPYFCGYMSLSSLPFSSISDTLQSGRSSVDKVKSFPSGEPRKLFQNDGIVMSQDSLVHKCPQNYYQCDNLFCIPEINRCDGRANCFDVSDEINCSCRDRILRDQICDGYFDCPHGEDELGCFDCPEDSFSCNYDPNIPHNCVLLSQRCDGIKQCINGKDEQDCTILSESYISSKDISTVGYTQGYLHKNIQGQWYPVCSVTSSWAIDACLSEIGQPLTAMPDMQIVRVSENVFQDPYVKEIDNQIKLTSCSGMALFVKCPPLPCGIKTVPHQNSSDAIDTMGNNYVYRRQARKQHVSYKFNKLYHETLGLLNAKHSAFKEKEQDRDILVGAQSRVVGGRASKPKAWPFLVAIYKDGRFHCGGVILSEIHVLTASHCMEGYEEHYYEIQAGILKRLSFSPTAQSRRARFVILHPDYESEDMQNDVSLIVLDKPFLFNRWVRQVCLPSPSIVGPKWKVEPSPLSMCIAIGWGALREDGPNADYLREVEVPILPGCKHLPDQNNATICAGYPEGGQDTCQGDSGGPLMCRNRDFNSQWYVAGLVSHGDGCARPDEPGVYMRISYFLDWIQQTSDMLNNFTDLYYKDKKLLAECPTFSCDDGRCLPMEQRCNRVIDCLNGEDEIKCYPFEVSNMNDQYRQSNSNNEIVKSQINETSDDNVKNRMSTEAIPIFTSNRFFYETEPDIDKDSTSSVTTSKTTNVRLTFTCKRLIQTIRIDKRCDRHLDCEDASDEEDCTCRDYLSNLQPTAICDGHLDCDDETDEKDCDICRDDEFHCSKSQGCIPITNVCDGNFDCPLSEDELDCLTLTDGEYVNVDSNDRSILNMEGLLSRYYNATWHVQCLEADILDNNTITSIIGRNLCEYLGFANLQSMDKVVASKTMLEERFWRKWDNITSYEPWPEHVAVSEEDETCKTLRIRCKQVLSSNAASYLIVDPRTGNHTYLWPWLAAVFVDGRYHCSALLLEPDWLLSSSSCTEDIKLSVNYTTVLLGQSRSYLYVDGPHQQISVVDEIRNVKASEVSLLHLKTAVNLTRHVQPLFLEKKIYPPAKDDLCVAVGTNKEHVTHSVFLRPVLQNCHNCYRCFVEASDFKCPINKTSLDWSGTVFCRSEKGWYPAAIFHESNLCSFRSMRNLTSIDYIHAFLMHALETEPEPTPESTCDGVRCSIGQCVPWSQVCDVVEDCRDGSDEINEICIRKVQQNRSSADDKPKKCARSELRCRNGECVSKGAFCDAKVDCSDGTDEPITCTCAEYLRLTEPKRLCDGVRHCLDKTDESPEMCQCTQTSFKCNAESNNVTCISQDFVCDGDQDCPNGEDETECRKIDESTDNRSGTGEVKQRSYGVWHSQCFSSPVTSQEEARIICKKVGYTNGNIGNSENRTLSEPVVPSRDDFYMIRLNSYTWVTMRDDKPLITLVRPEERCYRLFVTCN